MTAQAFTAADQEAFAALSGDRNPMHMDPVAARRTQAGSCAVHGIAATLWGLEALAAKADLRVLASLKADFQGFIPVGTPVTLAVTERARDRLRAEIRRDGGRAITLDLGLKPASAAGFAEAPAPFRHAPLIGADPVPSAALDRKLEDLADAGGTLAPAAGAEERAAELYPRVSAALGPSTVVGLALTSTLVGMVAPGLHSIFSGLSVAFCAHESGPPALGWRVIRTDERFRLATIEVASTGLSGTLRAFLRFPPVEPPAWKAAAERVPAGVFAGHHALVIGGSRGLGAAAALLLGAGGAEVSLTYRHGRAEADALAGRITGAAGVARTLPYDATAPAAPQLEGLRDVTDLFYFATGPISAGGDGRFRRERLDSLLAVYADGFADAVDALLRAAPGRPLRAFYPSTVYVENRPAGLTEYAMAKAAGEILAADLARAVRGLSVDVHRLPRTLTDQTASVPPLAAADPLDVMAGLLLGR